MFWRLLICFYLLPWCTPFGYRLWGGLASHFPALSVCLSVCVFHHNDSNTTADHVILMISNCYCEFWGTVNESGSGSGYFVLLIVWIDWGNVKKFGNNWSSKQPISCRLHGAESLTRWRQETLSFHCRPPSVDCTAPVQPTGHYMYRQFNIQQFYVLPTQCIYVFCVDLRTNSDYFPIQL